MNEEINSQSISWGLAKRGKTHSGKLQLIKPWGPVP